MSKWRLGVDIGGTFTDAVLMDESGRYVTAKVPSTPADPAKGLLHAVDRVLEEAAASAADVQMFIHGTTVATNAIIQGEVADTALLVTAGFGDLLEIGYQIRPKLFDIFGKKAEPLIPRSRCFEIRERLDADGSVLESMHEEDIHRAADAIAREGVTSVAICFLHSYKNPVHEDRAAQILRKRLPGVYVTCSSIVCPEIGEYPRASTAAINAAILPIVDQYIEQVEIGLAERGITCRLHLMRSNGGILPSDVVRQVPASIVESGPAAGVMAAAYAGRLAGINDLIALDMGGTTAKAALVIDGKPRIVAELEVGSKAASKTSLTRGDGYPLRMTSVDLAEVGAGGGSIAWVDEGSLLRVGPTSAGAAPGPACYRRGGTEPTVTDANMVLGRLNPDNFLGGEMRLDAEASHKALRDHCATALGHDVTTVAVAVLDISVASMVNAVRLVTVEKGYDPRDFALVVTGGAGPLHANLIARELGIPRVLVPPMPGVGSALGLLVADVEEEHAASWFETLSEDKGEELATRFSPLLDRARKTLAAHGFDSDRIVLQRQADLRYTGQSHELRISVPEEADVREVARRLRHAFDAEHERMYGFASPHEDVEVVSIRVVGVGRVASSTTTPIARAFVPNDVRTDWPDRPPVSSRSVVFGDPSKSTDCTILQRGALDPGDSYVGPAIIEERSSTTVVLPDYKVSVDHHDNLHIVPHR